MSTLLYQNAVPSPLDGNPTTIGNFATRYAQMAEALRSAVDELDALANESVTISLAIDEVRDRAAESIDDARKVSVRYDGAATALSQYHTALSEAQAKANAARTLIEDNNPLASYWRQEREDLQQKALWGETDPKVEEDLKYAIKKVDYYDQAYADAMAKYHEAEHDRDEAARVAGRALDDAADKANLNDGFWDKVVGAGEALYDLAQKYLAPIIQELRAVLEILKQIVDVLALIVTILAIFIPILAPLAAALTLVSLALAVLIFACSLVLFALGKESLGRVLGDLINVAAGVITAKLGGAFNPGALVGTFAPFTAAGLQTMKFDVLISVAVLRAVGPKIGAEILVDIAKDEAPALLRDASIEFVSSSAGDFTEGFSGTVDDWASGGPAWGSDDGGFFDFDKPDHLGASIGGNAVSEYTGAKVIELFTDGFSEPAGDFAEAVKAQSESHVAFSAVPAG